MRIGIGYDVHRLAPNRTLIIGGVEIPYDKGLLGHSDADVLCHAVIDALLGAAKKDDIGTMFPDSDDAFKGISSLVLLERVCVMLYEDNYCIENIDCVVCAQQPKLSPYRDAMETQMARCMHISKDRVSVKFKTEEGLGFTGRGEGISAQAVCLIDKAAGVKFLKA